MEILLNLAELPRDEKLRHLSAKAVKKELKTRCKNGLFFQKESISLINKEQPLTYEAKRLLSTELKDKGDYQQKVIESIIEQLAKDILRSPKDYKIIMTPSEEITFIDDKEEIIKKKLKECLDTIACRLDNCDSNDQTPTIDQKYKARVLLSQMHQGGIANSVKFVRESLEVGRTKKGVPLGYQFNYAPESTTLDLSQNGIITRTFSIGNGSYMDFDRDSKRVTPKGNKDKFCKGKIIFDPREYVSHVNFSTDPLFSLGVLKKMEEQS